MKKNSRIRKVLLAGFAAAALPLSLAGCGGGEAEVDQTPPAATEHPESEHPKSEHPKSEHPGGEHPK